MPEHNGGVSLKDFYDMVCWKISLFSKFAVMEYKNWRLEQSIRKERKKAKELRQELEQITGEVVF